MNGQSAMYIYFTIILVFTSLIILLFVMQLDPSIFLWTDTDPEPEFIDEPDPLPYRNRYLTPLGLSRGSKYWLSTFPTNSYDAHKYCMDSDHGSLVSIETDVEQAYIALMIGTYGNRSENFWTSGTDLFKETEFMWNTGDQVIYDNYNNAVNNSDMKNCIGIIGDNSFKWDILPCLEEHLFLCESPVCDCDCK